MRLECHPQRVLVLGASGLLGSDLVPTLREAGIEITAPASGELDIRDLDLLREFIKDTAPDLIINSAAQSSVEHAEEHPEEAFAVNAVGAHNVALAAAEADKTLMHLSTDYVFDGQRGAPYCEFHSTGLPPNHYGRSKLQGEQLVRASWPRHFIVRVSALFGVRGRPDFVDCVLDQADPATPLRIVCDRVTCPTWTWDLSRQLLALARTPYYGTYHATGRGAASWYQLAHHALAAAGRDPDGVIPVPDRELESVATRAPYTALDNHLLQARGLDTMMPWQEALTARLKG